MRAFAGRLIADEEKGGVSAGNEGPAAFRVLERMRPHLATLMGITGFRGLVSRTLMLANPGDPWLRGVQVKSDGTLEEWDGIAARVTAAEVNEGGVTLVAEMVALLVSFIGESLTLKILGDVWPELFLSDFDF
jgi:hypothetical protein